MSNVKIILVGNADAGLKYAPQGIWAANKMRLDGHGHGEARSFPFGDVLLRVILDDYAGDKCYIHTDIIGCPLIGYNGYLDTFSGGYDMDTSGGRRMVELQQDVENLPRTRDGVFIAGDPKMHGIRKVPAYNASTDPAPTLPPGQTISTDSFPLVSVDRDTHDEAFRDVFTRYSPSRFSGLMRKVLQCTFGSGAWWDISYMGTSSTYPPVAQRKLKVNFCWDDSWGVILAPGKDGSQGSHYFLIQIGLNVVQWVPADFCVHKVEVDSVDDYAPVLRKVDTAGSVIIGELPALGGSSCSRAIGWSFSYMDPKASVVIYGDNGIGNVTVKLVTLSVRFSEGTPSSVVVDGHETRENILWNHLPTQKPALGVDPSSFYGLFNFPFIDSMSGKIVLASMQNIYDTRSTPIPVNYTASNIPIHVFYSPKNRRANMVAYSYEPVPETLIGSDEVLPWRPWNYSYTGYSINGSYVVWGFSFNGDGLPPVEGSVQAQYTELAAYENGNVSGDCILGDKMVNSTSRTGGGKSVVSTCTLSTEDIECAVIYARSDASVSGRIYSWTFTVDGFIMCPTGYDWRTWMDFTDSGTTGWVYTGAYRESAVTVYSNSKSIELKEELWGDVLRNVVDTDDGKVLHHSSAGFAPDKYFTYESAPGLVVVSMDGEEYTPTNAVRGWIGVV